MYSMSGTKYLDELTCINSLHPHNHRKPMKEALLLVSLCNKETKVLNG